LTVGLIVPDVHEKIVKLKRILELYSEVAWVLFLGDFLDSFDGLTEYTHETCKWLADNVENPKYRFLYGNHDIHYAWPMGGLVCSGYTIAKQKVVTQYLRRDQWNHFRLMAWVGKGENEWLCTHAGLHPNLLHPVNGFEHNALLEMEERALRRLTLSQVDELVAAGRARGGRAIVGGVDWLDWNLEFEPIEGLNQIVGHTIGKTVREKHTSGSRNYCIDTNLNHVVLVGDDGRINIEEVI
jgi:hypothetical protein